MRKTTSGFTIVELLIVIVVIAILAAISIVAYNGIQQRSRASAASSAASQAKKKLEIAKIDNSDQYPASLSAAGISNTGSTYYQYSTTGNTFCLTASVSGTSYNVSNSTGPAVGACSGQVEGGTITNLADNPSVEANTNGWSNNYGASGAGNTTRPTTGGHSGSAYMRMTWTTASTSSWGGINFPIISVNQGEALSASVWVRTNSTQSILLRLRPNNWPSPNTDIDGPTVAISANTWTRLTVTQPSVPSGVTTYFPLTVRQGSGTWQVGNELDHDSLMIVKSSTLYNFADGNTTDWSWNGTVNNSTSTGPPL